MPASDFHSQRALPPLVQRLIERDLRSAQEIELLLLLQRSPETFWTPAAAASVIGAGVKDAHAHLARFTDAGLLERAKETDAFRYAPASEDDHIAITALAEAYAERRDDVLRAITGSLSQIAAFSDAFRFPKL